ncbi:MAG: metal ABC transporter substrate-binding protein [Phycisphaerales bacterium]
MPAPFTRHTRPPARLARALALLIALPLLAIAACGPADDHAAPPDDQSSSSPPTADTIHAADTPSPSDQLRIVVSIPPLAWVARGLAPDSARITTLLRPGASEHGFEITPAQVIAIRDADIVFLAGFGLEPRIDAALARFPNQQRRIVRLEDSVPEQFRLAAAACCPLHADEAHDHDHHHTYTADPHAWLDPILMARFIDDAATAFNDPPADPSAPPLSERIAALQAECAQVHQHYVQTLTPLEHRSIVVMHNAYNYLAARYGLEIVAVIRPVETAEPTPADLANANNAINQHAVRAIFSEPQFPLGPARRLAELTGVRLETLDPLGDHDWPATMHKNLDALQRALAPGD